MQLIAYLADNLIELLALRRADDETFLNGATVACQLKDTDGTAIDSSISMPYVAASDGIYRGTIPDSATLVEDSEIRAEISADAGAALQGFWDVPCHVVVQRG